jgi:hypothetical protein
MVVAGLYLKPIAESHGAGLGPIRDPNRDEKGDGALVNGKRKRTSR